MILGGIKRPAGTRSLRHLRQAVNDLPKLKRLYRDEAGWLVTAVFGGAGAESGRELYDLPKSEEQ